MERFKATFRCRTWSFSQIYIPIWRDLKRRWLCLRSSLGSHLHSNMERFKERTPSERRENARNLHSNMERFKAFKLCNNALHKLIYIPIWRDLKSLLMLNIIQLLLIYIPIWRDLKHQLKIHHTRASNNLHSNMERFKAVQMHNSIIRRFTFTFQYGEI